MNLQKKIVIGMVCTTGLLIALLQVVAAVNRSNRLVGLNEELACFHWRYSVSSVRKTRTLDDGTSQKTAHGAYYIVTLKVRNNRNGSSHFRTAPQLVDGIGTAYRLSYERQKAGQKFDPTWKPHDGLDAQFGPAETRVFEVVFDAPTDVRDPRLKISLGNPIGDMLYTALAGDREIRLSENNGRLQ